MFHDSAAALLVDGRLVAAAEEERFSRRKHDGGVPWRAVRACLATAGVALTDVDVLAYYEDPAMKLDRQLMTVGGERRDDVAAAVLDRLEPAKVFCALREQLGWHGPVEFVPHHLSHAASAFYFSGAEQAGVLVLDAVGEWATSSCGEASSATGVVLHECDRFPHSLGLFYSAVTSYLGFGVNDGEYKTMGLAPYGEPTFVPLLRELIATDGDGRVQLNLDYIDVTGLTCMWHEALVDHLQVPPRDRDGGFEAHHADLARSAQVVLEEIALEKARHVRRRTAAAQLCLAGGVALNCPAIARLRTAGLFADIFVQPAAGDAGGALGAAAVASHRRGCLPPVERLRDVRLGPGYTTDDDVWPMLGRLGIDGTDHAGDRGRLLDDVVERLLAGQVVAWFQGRMEFGPRALGARSILADPRRPDMRHRINALVKEREAFRPFAPAALEETAARWFAVDRPLPFMVEVVPVETADLPAVTHVDGTARLQTVRQEDNPAFHALLDRWQQRTGCGVLLNTSFNQRGEPIVASPADAVLCFVRSGLDALVIEDVVVDAAAVPPAWAARLRRARAVEDATRPGELAVYATA